MQKDIAFMDFKKLSTGQRIGLIIDSIRDANGDKISQVVFGQLIGVGQSTVGNLVTDFRTPQTDMAERIESITGYRREWILFGTGPMRTKSLKIMKHEGDNVTEYKLNDTERQVVDAMRKMSLRQQYTVVETALSLVGADPHLPLISLDELKNPPNEESNA